MENNIINDAELVDVTDRDGKINLTFLKDDMIYEVVWNKRKYDPATNDRVESPEKEQQVEGWSEQFFGVPSKDIAKELGSKHDVYVYDTFASLWENTNKFTKEQNGKSYRTEIERIDLEETQISIWYRIEDKLYSSKMSFNQKIRDAYYLNPIKQRKQFAKFETKFGVPVEQKDELIGQEILVKVKCAFGKFYYGEVEKL